MASQFGHIAVPVRIPAQRVAAAKKVPYALCKCHFRLQNYCFSPFAQIVCAKIHSVLRKFLHVFCRLTRSNCFCVRLYIRIVVRALERKKRPLSRATVPQTIKIPIELQRIALAGRTALAAAFVPHTLPIGGAHLFAPAFTIPSVCVRPVPVLSVLLVICALLFGCHFPVIYEVFSRHSRDIIENDTYSDGVKCFVQIRLPPMWTFTSPCLRSVSLLPLPYCEQNAASPIRL